VAPPPPAEPDPELAAERALLAQLRARRAEIEARERDLEAREVMAAASERRLAARVEELARLVQQLEALERGRREREEAGWRGLVRLYEGMRPRDAAAIFDELEMPVLVEVVDRMREAKAAPVLGAMRPERARLLTTELARHRAERPGVRAAD
jgi:flagellar motility protein MotE (MotC chaperone)